MLDTASKTGKRMAALRKEMMTFDVDGFIIPRSDEHQGEYVAPHSERLSWLTGFTGSAGYAIVLAEHAALFVDGRYTLQVTQECDGDLFEFRHVMDQPATDWLSEHLKEDMKLAYDPWLHTGPGLHRLKEAVKKICAKLVSAPHNFIDAIWADRPAAPSAPLIKHDIQYAGLSHHEKLKDIAKLLKNEKQDGVFLSLPDSIAWAFNIRGSDIPCTPVALGFALITNEAKAELFFSQDKISKELMEHLGENVEVHGPDDLIKRLDFWASEKKTIRIEGSSAPVYVHERLKDKGAKVVLGDDPCALPKACKNETEIDGMEQAHIRDGHAMIRFLYWLEDQPFGPDINEMSVSDKLDSIRAEHDMFFDYSFPTISGAAENGAIVHYRVSQESSIVLPENGLYLVDSGAQYLDGTTDVTRTVCRGNPTGEMKDRFTRVLKGHIAISSTRFPKGTTGSQLDVLARHALWQAGLDYDHGTGHGVGSFLNVHEGPHRISKMGSTVALQPGMVVSNEPGYYKNAEYGIRIENLICVKASEKKDGEERDMLEFYPLTQVPIDQKLIEVSLLTDNEIAWINAYHEEVFQTLKSLELSEEEQVWLQKACAAI